MSISSAILWVTLNSVTPKSAELWGNKILEECNLRKNDIYKPDPLDIVALCNTESNFKPHVINKKTGAMGLCQVMYFHHKRPKLLLNPLINIKYAVAIYSNYLHKCKGNRQRTISAYNGRGCVKSKWARKVMLLRQDLQQFSKDN